MFLIFSAVAKKMYYFWKMASVLIRKLDGILGATKIELRDMQYRVWWKSNPRFLEDIAKGYSTRGSQICKKHSFNFSKDNGHSIEDEEFNQNWLNFDIQCLQNHQEMKALFGKFLMRTSLVLTSLSQQLSENTPDSYLILLK